MSTGRRDSLGDYKRGLPQLNQYYGALGSASASPAGPMGLVQTGQSLTPPPSLSGSNSNLALASGYGYDYGLGGSTRLYNAAPGAEAKFRNGSLTGTNGLFGSSLFPSRILAKRYVCGMCNIYTTVIIFVS